MDDEHPISNLESGMPSFFIRLNLSSPLFRGSTYKWYARLVPKADCYGKKSDKDLILLFSLKIEIIQGTKKPVHPFGNMSKNPQDSGSLLHIMKTFSTFLFSFWVFQYKNEMLRCYRHEDTNDEFFYSRGRGQNKPASNIEHRTFNVEQEKDSRGRGFKGSSEKRRLIAQNDVERRTTQPYNTRSSLDRTWGEEARDA
jgi:hypothetical protein